MVNRRTVTALLAVTACGAALTGAVVVTQDRPVSAERTSAETAAAARWRKLAPPTPTAPGALSQVDAASAKAAWAVGAERRNGKQVPALYRWNGSRWLRHRSPVVFAPTDVAVAGPKAAWTAGVAKSGPVALHWNGRAWRKVPIPAGAGAINALAAGSDGSAWAGAAGGSATGSTVLRWRSGRWRKVKVPLPAGAALAAVGARTKKDVWVAGAVGGRSLVMRWNGKTWKQVALPPAIGGPGRDSSGVVRIRPVSATNVLALRGPTAPALLRWNGKRWIQKALPSGHIALSLSDDGKGGAWVIPYNNASRRIRKSYYLHWNGRAWRKVYGPARSGNVQLGDLDRLPKTTSLLSVGALQGKSRKTPLIERYR